MRAIRPCFHRTARLAELIPRFAQPRIRAFQVHAIAVSKQIPKFNISRFVADSVEAATLAPKDCADLDLRWPLLRSAELSDRFASSSGSQNKGRSPEFGPWIMTRKMRAHILARRAKVIAAGVGANRHRDFLAHEEYFRIVRRVHDKSSPGEREMAREEKRPTGTRMGISQKLSGFRTPAILDDTVMRRSLLAHEALIRRPAHSPGKLAVNTTQADPSLRRWRSLSIVFHPISAPNSTCEIKLQVRNPPPSTHVGSQLLPSRGLWTGRD